MTSSVGEAKTQKAKVVYDYEAEDDSQLTIKAGQVILLIGNPTPEGWILAQHTTFQNKKKYGDQEAYIPVDYYEPMGKPAGPPPVPGGSTGKQTNQSAYTVQDEDDDGMILEQNDTHSLFTYQLEWFTIPCIFIGALLSFMYSTPQTSADKWRLGVCSWLTFLVAALAAYVCGMDRNRFKIAESSALVRMLVFLLATLLLGASYPVGVGSAIVCLLTTAMELRLHFLHCKDLPKKMTDTWCAVMFGGTDNCSPVKLALFFVVLIVDAASFAWGFVDGYDFADTSNAENPSRWLNVTSNAFMWAFGRVITINLCLILLVAGRGCFSVCTEKVKQCVCKDKAGPKFDVVGFVHRCMGYSIVVASFLHLVCVYFTYEDSLATHTFLDSYGWETFGTGWALLLLLASVVGSSNTTLPKTNKRLFKQTHWQSILMVFILIVHGKDFLSTVYWQLIIAPVVFYFCNVLTTYLRSN